MAEEEKSKGKISIENGELIVRVSLTQEHAKILAKGLLIDAINVVDEFFFTLKMKKAQRDHASGILTPGIGRPQ